MNRREEIESGGPASEPEKTLRLVASLPAPDRLSDRVQESLQKVPRGHVLEWPTALMPGTWWMSPALRGAAAAAIVCIVAGGGWRIYSRVQAPSAPAANVVVMPARVGTQGAFSNAGAMRTPDTLAKPVLTHAIVPKPAAAQDQSPAKHQKTRRRAPVSAQPVSPR